MTRFDLSATAAAPARRDVLHLLLRGCCVLPALALAACANRRDLPEERRTRGKYGHRGDGRL